MYIVYRIILVHCSTPLAIIFLRWGERTVGQYEEETCNDHMF